MGPSQVRARHVPVPGTRPWPEGPTVDADGGFTQDE